MAAMVETTAMAGLVALVVMVRCLAEPHRVARAVLAVRVAPLLATVVPAASGERQLLQRLLAAPVARAARHRLQLPPVVRAVRAAQQQEASTQQAATEVLAATTIPLVAWLVPVALVVQPHWQVYRPIMRSAVSVAMAAVVASAEPVVSAVLRQQRVQL
jgi:hypothetical protein